LNTLLSTGGVKDAGIPKGAFSGRTMILTGVTQLGCAVLGFVVSAFTGGPQIAEGLEWYVGFWFSVFVTGILNIAIQNCNTAAKPMMGPSLHSATTAFTPAFVIVVSGILIGEWCSWGGVGGILVVLLGAYLWGMYGFANNEAELKKIQAEASGWLTRYLAPLVYFSRIKGMNLAAISVACSILSLQYDGLTARSANLAFGFGMLSFIVAVGSFIGAVKAGEFKDFLGVSDLWTWRTAKLLGSSISLFFVAHLFFGAAYREALVPYVGTLKRLNIPGTAIVSKLAGLEKSRFGWRLLFGLMMAAGAVMIGFTDEEVGKWIALRLGIPR
jgi:hypothetical protein